MFSFRNAAFLLALTASAGFALHAQNSGPSDEASSASSNSALSDSSSTQETPPSAQQVPAKGPLSVQARIRARREQRRATAINDVYSHLYEAYFGAGYLRFTPGPGLQRLNEYSWNVGFTRYYSKKFGVTVDGRGTYGTAFVGLSQITSGDITNPAISQYAVMAGPTYRFILQPKYSLSGRVMAGAAFGNFSGDLGSFTPAQVGLYPNGTSIAISASTPFEYNVSPNLGLRVAPEYFLTNFGSTTQNNLGFTGGVVVRWGKQ